MISITENVQQKKSAVLEMRLVIVCSSEAEGRMTVKWFKNYCIVKVAQRQRIPKKSFNFTMKMFIINVLSTNTLYFILSF